MGIAHKAGEDMSLVYTGGPQFFGEGLALAGAARDGADLRHGQAERRGGVNTETRHAFALGEIGQSAHLADDFFSVQKFGLTFWPFFKFWSAISDTASPSCRPFRTST